MFREIFRKRDIVLISLMICFGIVFVIFSLLAPHQQKYPQGEEMAIEPERVRRSTTFMSSRQVKQGTSLSVSQAEEGESNDVLLDSNQESTESQIQENTLPSSAEDASEIASVDLSEPDEEPKKTEEETYPVGDLRRLTPQERIHRQKLIEEILALDKEKRTWADLDLPFEEWSTREEAHYKRVRRVAGQLNYYYKKLGYPPPPPLHDWDAVIIDPYIDGDLAQK